MRYVLYWIVMQLVLLSALQAQVPNQVPNNDRTFFEFPLPRQTVVLEFNQDECQVPVTEEYVVPDVPANPGNVALTMLFNAECDLGLSSPETVPMTAMGPSTAGTATMSHTAPREIIEEFLASPDSLRTVVKFGK
jgi:hypothetical protein